MKQTHTARGCTNASYIQSSGYLYGHNKPCIFNRTPKPEKTCLYLTTVNRIGRWYRDGDGMVNDMKQIFAKQKSCRTMSRQHYKHWTHINIKKTNGQRWKTVWKFS